LAIFQLYHLQASNTKWATCNHGLVLKSLY